MAIEKTKSGKYRVRIYQKGVKVHSSPTFDKKKDAEMYEAEFKNRSLKGLLGHAQDTVPVQEAFLEFAKTIRTCSEKHQKEVLKVIAKHIDHYGLKKVSDYKREFIENFIRNSTLSSCTLNRYVTHLKYFGKFLINENYLAHDNISAIKKPKAINKVKKRALAINELEQLFKTVQEMMPQNFNILYFLSLTGFRKMEAVSLEWENINFNNRTIKIYDKPHLKFNKVPFKTKWCSSRTIPMSNDVYELLSNIKRTSSFVFVNKFGNTLHNNLSRDFKIAVTSSGIYRSQDVCLHSLRHTWISHAINRGLDIRSVMEYAGHKNIQVTQGYSHSLSSPEKLKRDSIHFLSFSHPPHTHSAS